MDIALASVYLLWAAALVWSVLDARKRGRPQVHVESIRPGDTVVFQTDRPLPQDKVQRIRKAVMESLPENTHVLVAENMAVHILRKEDSNAG